MLEPAVGGSSREPGPGLVIYLAKVCQEVDGINDEGGIKGLEGKGNS